jgi:predicted TIM-barrel fold metal-dependent hydrolase
MKRFPWLTSRKKTAPELPYEPPVWFGNKSNGECWWPATRRDRLTRKLILEKAAENARRVGMERRQFLASSMGMATSLWVMNYVSACSSEEGKVKGGTSGTGGASGDGGGGSSGDASFCVPPEAMFDENCANGVISGDQFIFDVQTHWFHRDDLANFSAYQMAFGPLFAVATEDAYINTIFCNSDTSMTALTSWPGISCTPTRRIGCGMPLSNQRMLDSRKKINDLAGSSQRVVNHIQILPQDPSGIEEQLRIMEEFFCTEGVAAWKLYPGFKPGWKLHDDTAEQVIRKGLDLGVNLFCVHKGLPIGNFFDVTNNYPDDVGPAAKKFPEANFVIYHSAICAGSETCGAAGPEGPYDETAANPGGVNALIRSVLDAGLAPGSNVFGEVGTSYNNIKSDPVVSAHFFGKLMKYLGEENVVWGTDSIINGNPQAQIDVFRTLEIPQSMRDEFGYPALGPSTPEGRLNQERILGLNAAKIYGVDVERQRCLVESCPLTHLKREMDQELGPRRYVFEEPNGPKNYADWLEGALEMEKTRRPG